MTPRISPVLLVLSVAACAAHPRGALPEAPASRSAVRAAARPANLPKDINKSFKDPALDVGRYVDRFERESREVFALRHRIAAVLQLAPGEAVADIGAGTGLFMDLLANGVGRSGKVYEVDISKRFVEHLGKRARSHELPQVDVVLCTDRSTELKPGSIDAAFVCDTYHHFEHPAATLASLQRALKPGGRLVVVDFERIPGESSEWLLNHVRAGKAVFRSEIEAAGFRFVKELGVEGLKENYVLRFAKR